MVVSLLLSAVWASNLDWDSPEIKTVLEELVNHSSSGSSNGTNGETTGKGE